MSIFFSSNKKCARNLNKYSRFERIQCMQIAYVRHKPEHLNGLNIVWYDAMWFGFSFLKIMCSTHSKYVQRTDHQQSLFHSVITIISMHQQTLTHAFGNICFRRAACHSMAIYYCAVCTALHWLCRMWRHRELTIAALVHEEDLTIVAVCQCKSPSSRENANQVRWMNEERRVNEWAKTLCSAINTVFYVLDFVSTLFTQLRCLGLKKIIDLSILCANNKFCGQCERWHHHSYFSI